MAGRGRRGQHDRALGAWGEQVACNYLDTLGWKVVDRNWRCDAGELDVVAYDPPSQTMVFVEVKTRAGQGYGMPLEAITWAKQQKLRDLAWRWLRAHPGHPYAARVRIDGVGVLKRGEQQPDVQHARGVAA